MEEWVRLAVTSGDPMDPLLPHLALVQLLVFHHGTSQFGDLEAMGVMSAMFQADAVTHLRGGWKETKRAHKDICQVSLHYFIYHLWVCRVGKAGNFEDRSTNIEAFDNSDYCLPRIHWFWIIILKS